MGGLDFYAGGAIQYEFASPTQFVSGDLSGMVLSLDETSLALDGGALFTLKASVLDFGVANGAKIGQLDYALAAGGSVEEGSFHFYNFDFTNGSCDANGYCAASGQYRLWGNNWDNGVADRPDGNVLVDGVVATRHRGIDLGGRIAPVPEPSAALLFGLGALAVGAGIRRD